MYQVSFKSHSGKGRVLTSTAYKYKRDAQKYADDLNKDNYGRNARVVNAKKGTYNQTK